MSKEELDEIDRDMEAARYNPGLENTKAFLSSPYIRSDAPISVVFGPQEAEDASREAAMARLRVFKQWLKEEASAGGTLHQEPVVTKLPPPRYDELGCFSIASSRSLTTKLTKGRAPDLVLLARRDGIPKEADTDRILKEMTTSLGIREDIVGIYPTSSRNPDIHGYAYNTSKHLGGNIHYPDVSDRSSVAFTWTSTEKLTEKHEQQKGFQRAFETDFVLNAKSKKEASNGRLYLLLWPRESREEHGHFSRDTTAVTSENAHMIWLPGDYDAIEQEIFDKCLNPEDDGRIRFNDTHRGNIFWDTVLDHFYDTIAKGKHTSSRLRQYQTIPNKYSLKLCLLLALVRTLMEAEELLLDHEHSKEEIQKFFDEMSRQWRSVWRNADETLGMGLSGSECEDPAAESPRASREGLHKMLQFYKYKMENDMADMDMEVSFLPFSNHE